jgi:hypothetical protein
MRAFVVSGRVPPSTGITNDTIKDGELYGMGDTYPPDDLYAEDPTEMRKIMAMMSIFGQAEPSPTAASDLLKELFANINKKLKPGRVLTRV